MKDSKETVVSNQICRSASSICANIAESKYAHGRADFIA
ncbi:MAG: four helix bundle protein [Clostridia bacterium]|nr:four helix bundle protein [Clostridia bacterium]